MSDSYSCNYCNFSCSNNLKLKIHTSVIHQIEEDVIVGGTTTTTTTTSYQNKNKEKKWVASSGIRAEKVLGPVESEIQPKKTAMRGQAVVPRFWFDGIDFKCDGCGKLSYDYDFIYRHGTKRKCKFFDVEAATGRYGLMKEQFQYTCKICDKAMTHTKKCIRAHLKSKHGMNIEGYEALYESSDNVQKNGVHTGQSAEEKKPRAPKKVKEEWTVKQVEAKEETSAAKTNPQVQNLKFLFAKITPQPRKWYEGYTFCCDLCCKDFYSSTTITEHMLRSHPFAKQAMEEEDAEIFYDPTEEELVPYKCKICHQIVKHDERFISEHAIKSHEMSFEQYERIYETPKPISATTTTAPEELVVPVETVKPKMIKTEPKKRKNPFGDDQNPSKTFVQLPSPRQLNPRELEQSISEKLKEPHLRQSNSVKQEYLLEQRSSRTSQNRFREGDPSRPPIGKYGKYGNASETLSCPFDSCPFVTNTEHYESGRAALHIALTHGVHKNDVKHFMIKFKKTINKQI